MVTFSFFLFNFLSPFPILAAMSLTFSGTPASVNEDDSFTATVSLIDAPSDRIYFLRAALFETGETKYFGYTYNHLGQWHNQPSEHEKFLEITTSNEGSWSGQLKVKADLNSNYFEGNGEYQFKIGRYTQGGSLSWSDNTVSININYTPPPSPEPSPSPDPPTDGSPSPNPSPTVFSPSPSVSPKLSTQSTADTANSDDMLASTSGDVLGFSETTISGQTEEATTSGQDNNLYLIPIVLVVLGLGLATGAGTILYKEHANKKTDITNIRKLS